MVFDSLHVYSNEGNGVYFGSSYNPTQFNFTNSTIESNGSAEFYISNVTANPNIQFHVNHNTIRDTVNNNRTHSQSLVYTLSLIHI